MVESDSIHDEVRELLQELHALRWEEDREVESFARLLEERQGIIDRFEQIDGSLALVRATIARSPELTALHADIMAQESDLHEQAQALRGELHEALRKTGEGRRATKGYRLGIRPSPAMIDRSV